MAAEPSALVLDEPTTGLDVVTQAFVLDEIRMLLSRTLMAAVYISHDLEVVESLADRVAVMYGGLFVETGLPTKIIADPRHPYTRGLVASIPNRHQPVRLRGVAGVAARPGELADGCPFAPRCVYQISDCTRSIPTLTPSGPGRSVRCLRSEDLALWASTEAGPILATPSPDGPPLLRVRALSVDYHGRASTTRAVVNLDLDIGQGERIGIVGQSGSGKTTLARCIIGLVRATNGSIALDGLRLASALQQRTVGQLRRIQMVFQNPFESLNPRRPVEEAIARPAQRLRGISHIQAVAEARELLERVRLPAGTLPRYPGELSGGECQRVAIAQALSARPALLICDEITSSLDVSVQAAIVELLRDLSDEFQMALLFVTHDLGIVASIAQRIIVMQEGLAVESGPPARLLSAPQHPYTKSLLAAADSLGLRTQEPNESASSHPKTAHSGQTND